MSIIHTDNPPLSPLSYKLINDSVESASPSPLTKKMALGLKALLITGGVFAGGYAIGTIVSFPTPLTSFVGTYAAHALSFFIWNHQLILTRGVWGEIGKLVGHWHVEDKPQAIAGKLLFKAAAILPCVILWVESSQLLCSGKTLFVLSSLILPTLPFTVLLGTYYYFREIDLLNTTQALESVERV